MGDLGESPSLVEFVVDDVPASKSDDHLPSLDGPLYYSPLEFHGPGGLVSSDVPEAAGEDLDEGVVLQSADVDGGGLFVQSSFLGLGVAVLGGGKDEGLAGKGEDDHAVVLLLLAFLEAPDVLRLVVPDCIELLHFQPLLDDPEIALASA